MNPNEPKEHLHVRSFGSCSLDVSRTRVRLQLYKTDIFGLLKSKLLLLKKKINTDNDKLTLLLIFPYIRITKYLEELLYKHRLKRVSPPDLEERLRKQIKTKIIRVNMKLIPKKKKRKGNK